MQSRRRRKAKQIRKRGGVRLSRYARLSIRHDHAGIDTMDRYTGNQR